MNKRVLVVAAALAMLALIAAAFALDCVRLADQARRRVDIADQELARHEQRLVNLLGSSQVLSTDVQLAISAHQHAKTTTSRHIAFEQLRAVFGRTMQPDVDPTDPLDRKFMDDVAGAINRRERAEPPFEAELLAYQSYLSGSRGGVARWFSPRHRDRIDSR